MDILKDSIKKALQVVRKGGVILYPTDTVWGIGCDATNKEAISRIYKLKKREDTKSLIILVADERTILQYVADPYPEVFKILEESIRPTTVIYNHALNLPDNLINVDGSIAIRICKEPFAHALVKRLGKPIVSTSANISGEPTARIYSELSQPIREGVDYIVEYRQTDQRIAPPSKIIKVGGGGEITVVRE